MAKSYQEAQVLWNIEAHRMRHTATIEFLAVTALYAIQHSSCE